MVNKSNANDQHKICKFPIFIKAPTFHSFRHSLFSSVISAHAATMKFLQYFIAFCFALGDARKFNVLMFDPNSDKFTEQVDEQYRSRIERLCEGYESGKNWQSVLFDLDPSSRKRALFQCVDPANNDDKNVCFFCLLMK